MPASPTNSPTPTASVFTVTGKSRSIANRRDTDDNRNEWMIVDGGTDIASFYVEDETGRVLVDTTQAPTLEISDGNTYSTVEDEGDEERTGGAFRTVEGCSTGVGGFPVTAPTPDPVGAGECVEAVCAAVWTGALLPGGLETPLDDGIERLGPKSYYAQFHEFC